MRNDVLPRGIDRGPMCRPRGWLVLPWVVALLAAWRGAAGDEAAPGIEFFESRVRPVLVAHCYRCHSAEAEDLKGGLRLDIRAGWQQGGESGEPAIVPGKPDESLLIRAVRHEQGVSAMPPDEGRLPGPAVRDLVEWVRMGAPDPREGAAGPGRPGGGWEAEFQRRLDWWSLQPLREAAPPEVAHEAWVKTDVDRFI